jgi:hypothetical protein
MPQAKMIETAAEKYRRIKAEKAANETLHDVDCECGMTWKCRKANMEFWVTSGILPMHLVEKMVTAMGKAQNPENMLKTMATKEVIESIVFSSKVVRYTAVEPRIVETVEGPNDISQEDTMTCCYNTLLKWQMFGGEEAARLGNFRNE